MASTYHTQIQALYVAYFNRPADYLGLNYWESVVEAAAAAAGTNQAAIDAAVKASLAGISAGFAASQEYKDEYAGLDTEHVVGQVYQNLFGHAPDLPGLVFWSNAIRAGHVTLANAVTQIAAGAQGSDLVAYNNKVTAATEFTKQLDTGAEVLAYSGAAALAAAKLFIAGVTTDASLAAAIEPAALAATIANMVETTAPGVTYTLTAGVDAGAAFTGAGGRDTFNANVTTLSALDSLNGGGGIDTLNVYGVDATGIAANVDLTLASSIEQIELLNVIATASELAGDTDLSAFTGLTQANIALGTLGATRTITFGDETAVIVSAKGGADLVIKGGTTVNVTQATTDDVEVYGGEATTAVTTVGGQDVYIEDNTDGTIASVTATGYATSLEVVSDALTSLSLANSSGNVTVDAAAGTRVLALSANKLGGGVITDNTATTVNVTSTGTKSSGVTLTTDSATTVNFAGDKSISLAMAETGVLTGTVTTISAAASTGGVTITSALAANTAFTGSAAADSVVLTTGNTKAIDMGAGDDTVAMSGAVGTGGSVDGGAGTNTLKMAAADAATVSATATFEAGVANFQKLSIGAVSGTTATINLANLDDISYVKSAGTTGGTAGTAEVQTLVVTTGSAANVAEVQTITVTAAATANGSISVGGVLVNVANLDTTDAIAGKIAAESAAIIAANPNVASVAAVGSVVTVTYNAAAGDLANIAFNANTGATGVTGTVAEGTAGNLGSGNITVGNATIALAAGMSVDAVGAAIAAAQAAIIAATPSVASVTYDAATDTVTVTHLAASGDVGQVTLVDTGSTGAAATAATTTPGVASVSAGFALTNMGNGGTLEVNGIITSASSVALKDSTGSTDSLNLLFSAADGFTNTAAIVASSIETLAIVTADTDDTAIVGFGATIDATSAKTVTVTGNAGLALSLNSTALTSFDASGVTATGSAGAVSLTTGALAAAATLSTGAGNDTIVATAATKAVTINTNAGNDTVIVNNAKNNIINTGVGNDTIEVGSGANVIDAGAGNDTITLGASAGLNVINVGTGNDTIVLGAAPTAAGYYASVTGFGAGDKLNFDAVATGATTAGALGAKLTLGEAASFANYLDAASASATGGANSVIKWFQFGGNTYVVVDNSNTTTFADGVDSVIQLVGAVDLSAATTTTGHIVTLV